MTMIDDAICHASTEVNLRTRYEGVNIGTWVGFKHVNYLVEEAVLCHFQSIGHDVRSLYEEHGLCWEIVDIDTRIVHALHLDETVRATVSGVSSPRNGELLFDLLIFGDRSGTSLKLARSRVAVTLRKESRWPTATDSTPDGLEQAVVARISRPAPLATFGGPPSDAEQPTHPRDVEKRTSLNWTLRIPYFYCHFTERLQMSGYLRILEEAVDRLLAEHGVSIRTLLDQRQHIPVVPRSRISMLEEVYMEEELHVVLAVEDVFKNLTFTARMECYVHRDGELVTAAVGAITHGYATLLGRGHWELSALDDRLAQAFSPS